METTVEKDQGSGIQISSYETAKDVNQLVHEPSVQISRFQNNKADDRNKSKVRPTLNFSCALCKREYAVWGFCVKHIKTIHKDVCVEDVRKHIISKTGVDFRIKSFHLGKKRSEAACLIPEFQCAICKKRYSFKKYCLNHIRRKHKEIETAYRSSNVISNTYLDPSEFKCSSCDRIFLCKNLLRIHNLRSHGTAPKKQTQNKHCVECSGTFGTTALLRFHLQEKHNLDMSEQKFLFPNFKNFEKWKCDIERQSLSKYVCAQGWRNFRRTYYCHRSGQYKSKIKNDAERKHNLKGTGSCKQGFSCTSMIKITKKNNSIVGSYFPNHYHGNQKTVSLSSVEKSSFESNVPTDGEDEDMFPEIQDNHIDSHQAQHIKLKDINFIRQAFASEDYHCSTSDEQSVHLWVSMCSRMENSPILFYRNEETEGNKDLLLIIMTEFQKQILISAQKQVVSLDTCFRRKGGRFYLTIMTVMDDLGNAFPVAFCISGKVDKGVMSRFVGCIRESAGPLKFEYFMSDSEPIYYDSWREEMCDSGKSVWGPWYIDGRVKAQLRVFKRDPHRRQEFHKPMSVLMMCQNANAFQSLFRNYIDTLKAEPKCHGLLGYVEKKLNFEAPKWAYCYRKDIKTSVTVQLEFLYRTFCVMSREGFKVRLIKFIFVLMKFVRHKMIDRLFKMLDKEKEHLAVEAIRKFHAMGMEISTEQVFCVSDKIWLIMLPDEDEDDIFVTKMFDVCPELCSLRCNVCDICVHMYSCSCIHSMIEANLCQHIHAVVHKFVTPRYSPPISPAMDCDVDDNSGGVAPAEFQLYDAVLKRSHDVNKKIRSSKSALDSDSLEKMMSYLNKCVEICVQRTENPVQLQSN